MKKNASHSSGKPNPSVSIVIANWNGRQLLEKNLPLVLAAKKNKRNRISEIIVVDDKSPDDSVDYLTQNFSQDIKLVRHKKNRGFSVTANTGVRTARSPLVCLINTDVIPSEDFLVSVLPHFEDKNVFGVSLHEKGYGYAVGEFKDGFIAHAPGPEKKQTADTLWISGGSGIFRRSLWMKLKGFDERLMSPFYWEDVDLGYRALKRGYRLLWEPKALVVHKHESVINVKSFRKRRLDTIKERNELLFIWKNITSRNLFKKHIRGLFKRATRHPGYFRIILISLFKLGTVLKLRKTEKRESKVSDEAIFARHSR